MAADVLQAAGTVWVEAACQLAGKVFIAAIGILISIVGVAEVIPYWRRLRRRCPASEEGHVKDVQSDVKSWRVARVRWMAGAVLLLLATGEVRAVTMDGKRTGFMASVGAGAVPLNNFSGTTTVRVRVQEWSDSYYFDGRPATYVSRTRGRTCNTPVSQIDFAVGIGLSERNAITCEQAVWLSSDSVSLPSGFLGVFWTHYLKPTTGGLLVRTGAGQFVSAGPGWLSGRLLSAGVGYEFKNNVQALLNVSSGLTPGAIGDYKYLGVGITIRRVWY